MSQSCPRMKEGAIDRLVPIMLPTMIPSPSSRARAAIASPSVKPPHLSSLILTVSNRPTSESSSASDTQLSRSEEHTSELPSLIRISYAVFSLKKNNHKGYDQNQ